jgi:hypothetical protein
MDINTPRGQDALIQSRKAVAIYERHYPAQSYIETPQEVAATVDGLIIHTASRRLRAIVEIKSRYDLSLEKFQGAFDSEWLVTYSKLVEAAFAAKTLGVPLLGFCYLVADEVLLVKRLWQGGNWLAPIQIRETKTQATVNGGDAIRENAFIDMKSATALK